jgi:hypothetical protein
METNLEYKFKYNVKGWMEDKLEKKLLDEFILRVPIVGKF